jgi:hypothetical protein
MGWTAEGATSVLQVEEERRRRRRREEDKSRGRGGLLTFVNGLGGKGAFAFFDRLNEEISSTNTWSFLLMKRHDHKHSEASPAPSISSNT